MKEIQLTRGLVAIVDDEDYESLSVYKWRAMKSRSKFYASRTSGKSVIRLHNVLMNPPAGLVVDHINNNSLDNRRGNLRIATRQQNVLNSDLKRTSKHLGVSYKERERKWTANLTLGRFDTEAEAAEAIRRVIDALTKSPPSAGFLTPANPEGA